MVSGKSCNWGCSGSPMAKRRTSGDPRNGTRLPMTSGVYVSQVPTIDGRNVTGKNVLNCSTAIHRTTTPRTPLSVSQFDTPESAKKYPRSQEMSRTSGSSPVTMKLPTITPKKSKTHRVVSTSYHGVKAIGKSLATQILGSNELMLGVCLPQLPKD